MKRIVEEADGYQPHLIAPEMGYRRLLQECLVLFKGPADTAVGEVHHVLRSIVASTINSEDCKNLQQYTSLKREIVATASSSLGELCALCCVAAAGCSAPSLVATHSASQQVVIVSPCEACLGVLRNVFA